MNRLECVVVGPSENPLEAVLKCRAEWVIVMRSDCMWGARDSWYPEILGAIARAHPRAMLFVTLVNEPGPDWQVAGPDSDDMFEHRRIAARCDGQEILVPSDHDTEATPVLVVRRARAEEILVDGPASAVSCTQQIGEVWLLRQVYVVQVQNA